MIALPGREERAVLMTRLTALVALSMVLVGCASPGYLLLDGERIPIDVPVVHAGDPGGYDGTKESCWFDEDRVLPTSPATGCDTAKRYSRRKLGGMAPEVVSEVGQAGWNSRTLRERIRQFVIHYDVCATAERCFKVLHDVRGLSVHFLLDVDGTLNQTMDMKFRARHAGRANDASVGIEIAHIGRSAVCGVGRPR